MSALQNILIGAKKTLVLKIWNEKPTETTTHHFWNKRLRLLWIGGQSCARANAHQSCQKKNCDHCETQNDRINRNKAQWRRHRALHNERLRIAFFMSKPFTELSSVPISTSSDSNFEIFSLRHKKTDHREPWHYRRHQLFLKGGN